MVTKFTEEQNNIENLYLTLVKEVLSSMPGTADIKVTSGRPGADFTIKVTPTNERAAEIEIDVADRDFAFLHAGQGTTFEIPPWGGVNMPVGQREQLRALIKAIVEGKFEEQLIYAGSQLVAGKGTAHLAQKDVSVSWRRLTMGLLKSKTRKEMTYAPYANIQRNAAANDGWPED